MNDWLNDPLMVFDTSMGHRIYRKPNVDNDQAELWHSFHFATRLKLEASVYFCVQLLGAASVSTEFGLPLLVHRHRAWYGDAFFFELYSAYETLLQEINIIYCCDLPMDKVCWSDRHRPIGIKRNLDEKQPTLSTMMDKERRKAWFKKVKAYRNLATHINVIRTEETTSSRGGEQPWDMDLDEVRLVFIDVHAKKAEREDIGVCVTYLKNMVRHIHTVWCDMGQMFEPVEV